MKKSLIYAAYALVVIIFGIVFYNSARNGRITKYVEEELMNNLYEGNHDETIKNVMVVLDANEYIVKPIKSFESKNEEYSFNIDLHHYSYTNKNKDEYGLIFQLYNFKVNNIKDKVSDYDKYLLNKDLLGINIAFKDSDNKIIYSQNIGLSKNNKNTGGSSFGPLMIQNIDSKSYFVYLNNNKQTLLNSIEFSLVDGTFGNEYKLAKKPFAKINTTNNETSLYDNEEFILSEDILIANGLPSNPSSYDSLIDNYKNNSVESVDKTVLNKYNNRIVISMVMYGFIVLIITFILFFMKPLNKRRNDMKRSE